MDIGRFQWTRLPQSYKISGETIAMITKPYIDLWQRTDYHFRHDNAPVLQLQTEGQ